MIDVEDHANHRLFPLLVSNGRPKERGSKRADLGVCYDARSVVAEVVKRTLSEPV